MDTAILNQMEALIGKLRGMSGAAQSIVSAPPPPAVKPVGTIQLPASTRALLVNIGSNVDPVRTMLEFKDVSSIIAFEPIVPHLIPQAKNLYVIPAAVAGNDGVASMMLAGRSKNYAASASSLSHKVTNYSEVATRNATSLDEEQKRRIGLSTTDKSQGPTFKLVPIVSMQSVMATMPASIPLVYLKTDMQGYDFSSLSVVGDELNRFQFLRLECFLEGRTTYAGMHNDFCRDWLPHMTRIGMTLVGLYIYDQSGKVAMPAREAQRRCRDQGFADFHGAIEADAFWASPNRSLSRPPVTCKEWWWKKIPVTDPTVSAEQPYAAMNVRGCARDTGASGPRPVRGTGRRPRGRLAS